LQVQRDIQALGAELLAVARDAAGVGASYIRSRARDASTITWESKARADFVSEVDREAETRIGEILASRVPAAKVVGEELTPGALTTSGIAFIVDPLDGTTNFLHGYPQYAVSIGAAVDGLIVAGVVVHVPRGETFTGSIGSGAFLDGTPIRVSNTTDPSRALLGTGFPFKHADQLEPFFQQLKIFLTQTAGVRRTGAAALDLADVASGRFDAFWELRLAPWDLAAGALLVREAGGLATNLDGVDLGVEHSAVVASNGGLHPWMLERLQRHSL
jgi:myo-inositol-1(or 4)-monophosphatase